MAKGSTRRINFDLPSRSYEEMKKAMDEKGLKMSHFIREAIDFYNKKIREERLMEELKAGYIEKAESNRKISDDFKYVDGENI